MTNEPINSGQQGERPSPAPPGLSGWGWLALLIIVVATSLTYANSFFGVFVYDDLNSIRDNPYIRQLLPLDYAMSIPKADGGETVARRPVLSLTFALNWAVSQRQTWSYHLANLFIHVAAALLLFGIVRRTLCLEPQRRYAQGKSVGLAFVVALLWALHPLQTESVTFIVQRAESLMGMLFLLTVYASLRAFFSPNPGRWMILAIGASALGMGVKEVMIMAPLIVFLYDGVFVSDSYQSAWNRRRGFYLGLAGTWSVFVLVVVVIGGHGASDDFIKRDPFAYAVTQPGVVLYYFWLTVYPVWQAMHYNWPLATAPLDIVPQGLVIFALLGLTGWGLFRRRWYGFVGAWFFLILAPSSSFAALGQTIQEHRMYLSLAAVLLLIAVGVDFGFTKIFGGRVSPYAGGAVALIVAVAFAVLTFNRNTVYYSELALWDANIAVRPNSYVAHDALANELAELGLYDRAVQHYEYAIAIDPEYAAAHNNLATTLIEQGKLAESVKHLREAIRLKPDYGEAYYNIGVALYEQRKLPEATAYFRQSIQYTPDYPMAHYNLGNALADQGDLEQAIVYWHEAARLMPTFFNAHFQLGSAHHELGLPELAVAHFQQALQFIPHESSAPIRIRLGRTLLDLGAMNEAAEQLGMAVILAPENPVARDLLGVAYVRQDKLPEAVEQFEKALECQNDFARAHSNLGSALTKQGKLPEAIGHLREAIKIAPEFVEAHLNLGDALLQRNEIPEAIAHYRQALIIAPEYPDAHFSLAEVFVQQKQPEQAIEHYVKGLELAPSTGAIQLKLGQLYLEQGNRDAALPHLQKVVDLLPNSSEAKQALERVLKE